MSVYTPTFLVTINGVDYTGDAVDQVTITVGKNDIFDQTLPGYCSIELVNLSGASPAIDILDEIVIKASDSSDNLIELFTGEVTSVNNQITAAGANALVNTLIILGTGSLAKLVRKNAGANSYPQEFDGERIERILQDALFLAWEDLASTFEWDEVDASATWEDFGQQGIDTIDQGRYEVIARTGEIANASDLAKEAEKTGLGYLYETPTGLIGYADAERRTKSIANNSIALDADLLSAQLNTRLTTADVLNSVVIVYDDGNAEAQGLNEQSIEDYGLIENIINTILVEQSDAEEQALRYVSLRGTPEINVESITLNLTNDNIDNITRDALLGVSMDTFLVVTGLPEAIVESELFEGFVEGWTWTLSKNQLSLEMQVSNALYSAFEVQWEDYNPTTQWQNLADSLLWSDLAIG